MMAKELCEQYINEVVKPLLPNVECGSIFLSGSDSELAPNPVSSMLVGSPYEYKGKKQFIHYTSLYAAKSILQSGVFRMYSLASMCDLEELKFALKDTYENKSDFTIDNYKHEIFSLSMNIIKNKHDELKNNWLEYGDCGYGIGIVMSFPDDEKAWFKHYLGKILYGTNYLKKLKEFHQRHIHFTENIVDINIKGQVKNFLLPVAVLHKDKGYKRENEVRFFAINKSILFNRTPVLSEIIEKVFNGTTRWIEKDSEELDYYVFIDDNQKRFIELQLNPINPEAYNGLRPIPQIEKLILGPKLYESSVLNKKYKTIVKQLKQDAMDGLGYKIRIEKSSIKL